MQFHFITCVIHAKLMNAETIKNKERSCRRNAARYSMPLEILLRHSRSFEITPFGRHGLALVAEYVQFCYALNSTY